ncbi:unnamed protein product [Owenia fusiformis]|uniref:Ion transport domain-containing protein n=1 Tax=Owenia fusiformis TaxID=6347 RepID=A0A8S4PDJ7_OWEFU|nr:unnamed protein product [Owenia fusiformis]
MKVDAFSGDASTTWSDEEADALFQACVIYIKDCAKKHAINKTKQATTQQENNQLNIQISPIPKSSKSNSDIGSDDSDRIDFNEMKIFNDSVVTIHEAENITKNDVGCDSILVTSFHTALVHNDFYYVEKVLGYLDNHEKHYLLNTRIRYTPIEKNSSQTRKSEYDFPDLVRDKLDSKDRDVLCKERIERFTSKKLNQVPKAFGAFTFELPLALAASSGNTDMFEEVIMNGANLLSVDSYGNNIVHCLAIMAGISPFQSANMFNHLLQHTQSELHRQALLFQENKEMLTPLDIAVKNGIPNMVQLFLGTDGVYRNVLKECAMYQYVQYNVTAYERKDSDKASPMAYISELSEAQTAIAEGSEMLTTEPIKTWIETKFNNTFWVVLGWIVFWILFCGIEIALVVIFELKVQSDLGDSYLVLHILGIVFASMSIISEIVFCIWDCRPVNCPAICVFVTHLLKNLKSRQWSQVDSPGTGTIKLIRLIVRCFTPKDQPVAYLFTYRLFHFVFSLTAVLVFICQYFLIGGDFVHVLTVMIIILAFLCLLFFVHLVPSIGHLLVIIEKLLCDVLIFLIVFISSLIPMAACLYFTNADFVPNGDLRQSNLTEGGSYAYRIYETLLMTFQQPSSDFMVSKNTNIGFVNFLYIATMIVWSIFLLNALIGLIVKRAQDIAAYIDTMWKIQSLAMVLMVEKKFMKMPSRCYELCNCTELEPAEIIELHNTHVFLETFEVAIQSPGQEDRDKSRRIGLRRGSHDKDDKLVSVV